MLRLCMDRRWPLMAVVLISLLAGCPSSGTDSAADEFFRQVEAPQGEQWLDERARGFVADLPRPARIEIAERASTHGDADVRLYGAGLFYDLGLDTRGDQAVAGLVIRGDDLTALGWAWLHSADSTLMERRVAGISRILEVRLPRLTPAEQQRAQKFLCEGRSSACTRK